VAYHRYAGDRYGVIEFPFKILIIVVVLAITLPLILSGLDRYTEAHDHNQVEREVNRLRNAIVQVYSQGENASLVIEVDLPNSLEYIKLGANTSVRGYKTGRMYVDPLCYAIFYKMKNNEEKFEIIKSSAKGIPTTNNTAGDGPLMFGSGRSKVIFTKLYSPKINAFFIMATYMEV